MNCFYKYMTIIIVVQLIYNKNDYSYSLLFFIRKYYCNQLLMLHICITKFQ
jgi:hypothetical protein